MAYEIDRKLNEILREPAVLVRPDLGLALTITLIFALPHPAIAQEASASPPAVATAGAGEGEIIYSREVSNRTVGMNYTPGRTQTVVAGPTNLILGSVATGLRPISDGENAAISAAISTPVSTVQSSIALGLAAIPSAKSTGLGNVNIGSVQGSVIDGAIGQATGALGSAMGSLRSALGGGQ